MLSHFLVQVLGFSLLYGLAMLITFPFLIYFGPPKLWQRVATLLLSFPLDNEKLGLFSFVGAACVVLMNGLLWGLVVVGIFWLAEALLR